MAPAGGDGADARACCVASCVRGVLEAVAGRRCGSVVLAVFFMLMRGGVFGLADGRRPTAGAACRSRSCCRRSASLLAFPLASWWRSAGARSCPRIRTLCIVYVELIRGVPLISVLFMASFMFPLFMPQGVTIDVLLRVLVGITLFAAAYLAEVVRGGLQAIPEGQIEAAAIARSFVLADAAQDRAAAGAGLVVPSHHEQLHQRPSRTPRWSPSSACTS